MKHILDKLISEKQTVFLKGRSIGENTRFIYDLIERANADNIPGLLILLDFEKAFNSLEWNFIVTVNTSEFFGFGPSFIHWFTILYTDISSTVLNNGIFTDFFKLAEEFAKGTHFRPIFLFLPGELLRASIKNSTSIKGVNINNIEYLISQYADDLALTLADDLDILNAAIDCIDSFAHWSGLRANFNKTQALWIGVKRGCGENYQTNHQLYWNHEGMFKL